LNKNSCSDALSFIKLRLNNSTAGVSVCINFKVKHLGFYKNFFEQLVNI